MILDPVEKITQLVFANDVEISREWQIHQSSALNLVMYLIHHAFLERPDVMDSTAESPVDVRFCHILSPVRAHSIRVGV